jgi:hypothetical protein
MQIFTVSMSTVPAGLRIDHLRDLISTASPATHGRRHRDIDRLRKPVLQRIADPFGGRDRRWRQAKSKPKKSMNRSKR